MYDEATKLIDVHEAEERLRGSIHFSRTSEVIRVENSFGRIIDGNVVAPFDIPLSSRSAMDGYAVRAQEIKDASETAPVKLHMTAEIGLGERFDNSVPEASCIRIPTGGFVPSGLDTVVPVEMTSIVDGIVQFSAPLLDGENVDPAGSFVKKGEVLVHGGKVIGSNDIAALAAIGVDSISVSKKISVAIAPTGNELIPLGTPLSSGKVYDSNSLGLKAMLEPTGLFAVTHFGILKDDREVLKTAFTEMLRDYDLVITLGGTALGTMDLIPGLLSEMEPGIIFHGIRARPGTPTLFAMAGEKCIIGLPGPPVSAYLVMREIILPVLLEKAGSSIPKATFPATLTQSVKISRGKYNIVPVRLENADNTTAIPLSGSSAAIGRLSLADGYFVYDGEKEVIDAGIIVDVIPLHG